MSDTNLFDRLYIYIRAYPEYVFYDPAKAPPES